MIVWLNGAFGVGKTTVADLVCTARPGATTFDPEVIGWWLRRAVLVPSGDYQDLRSWRRLVTATAGVLDRLRPGPLVVPMTLLRERSTTEILGTLQARGHDVRHVLLDVSREELPRRIDAAGDEGTGAWRHAHVVEYERARPRLAAAADVVVDTTGRTPDEVAATLLAHLPASRRVAAGGGPRTGHGRCRPRGRTPASPPRGRRR